MTRYSRASLEALNNLKKGNERFANGLRSIRSLASVERAKELAENGQRPFAIILTCSDSRVPTETVFDQGLGDLFVIRVAGNIISPGVVASIEFAASQLETPLCVVMGHTKCGAIRAAVEGELKGLPAPTANLAHLLEFIRPAAKRAVETVRDASGNIEEVVRRATLENVDHVVTEAMARSPMVREKVDGGELMIVGAVYQLHTGRVEFSLPARLENELDTLSNELPVASGEAV